MNTIQDQLIPLATQVGRSAIAVIDAIAARGAFKGEELSTIGQLRDQCTQMIQVAENAEHAALSNEGPKKK